MDAHGRSAPDTAALRSRILFRYCEMMTHDEQGQVEPWIQKFLRHLAADRGASAYTQRNYRQALVEFLSWHVEERKQQPSWGKLQRADFRAYVRYLGRQ